MEHIRRLQGFAELLEVTGVTTDVAAALQDAGADGREEFSNWTLQRARSAVANLASPIADETVFGWIKEAIRLELTGVLNGNVRLKDGTPVNGAVVTVGGTSTITDPRGRFRVALLPLDRNVTVTVHHPELGYKLVTEVPVFRGSALVAQLVVLAGRPQAAKLLTELKGDRLPRIGSASMTTRVVPGSPDPADVLMVIDRYSGGAVRAASRFLDFDGGRFVRRVYRIEVADLPAGLQDGEDIERTGSQWVRAHYSAKDIAREIRLRRVKSRQPKGPLTTAQITALLQATARAAIDP